MSELAEEQKKQAIWCAHTLFVLGKTSGSSGNISFRIGEHVYISAGNTCFGTLSEDDFSVITMQNTYLAGKKPSKESPMHLAFYKAHPDMQAVIHTHGRYAVLWSCVPTLKEDNCIPAYTPYLNMKLGTVGLIPYASPGTEKLFQEFESHRREQGIFAEAARCYCGGKRYYGCFLWIGGTGRGCQNSMGTYACRSEV